MARNTIASRIHLSAALAASLARNGERLTAGLEERFGNLMGASGGSRPDQKPTFDLLSRALLEARDLLVDADREHRRAMELASDVRARRDELTGQLRKVLVGLRLTVMGALGAERAAKVLSLTGRISQDPVVVARLARKVQERVKVLEAPNLEAHKLEAPNLETRAIREQLLTLGESLEAACDATAFAVARQQHTQVERAHAAQALDAIYRPARQLLRTFGELARLPGIALFLRHETTKVGRPRSKPSEAPPALLLASGATHLPTESVENPS